MTSSSPSEPLSLPCERRERGCRLVVVTGGPGAGKTAVLEIARRSFCKNIAFIPEAAGIVFGGGFWRHASLVGRKAAQLAIFHVQRQMERVILEEGEVAFGLCDRGTIDGLAYWPEPEANSASFFREIDTTHAAELARYHAVIHLKTPASGHGYNQQNPLRVESAAEAQALDARILGAWAGHPNRIVIESSDDFLSKATAAIQAIKANLPDCCREHPVLFGP
nr:ATP-binding protein [Haliangium sp. UPWRP_2]